MVLFIMVVLAGCVTPFFMGSTKKEKIIGYLMTTADMALIVAMIYSDIIIFQNMGKAEMSAIGVCIILLGILIHRLEEMINPKSKKIKYAPKTHHQMKEQQHQHKVAS